MAFDPRGTNYAAMLRQRADADRGLTEAKRRKGERDREARIKESGKRSLLQKLGSTAARAGLAYATGGSSEALGFGGAVDEVMLGTDSEGRPVRNEYGELVRAGSAIYGGMRDKKAADIAGKRARNLQDYKNKVDLAEKMGVLDKEQGAKMLLSAEELRSAQKAQTAKADKAGVWGWKNEYDPLELSSSVLKGKEVADEIPYTPSLEDGISQEGRETHKRAGYAPSLEDALVQTGRGKPRPTYHPSLEDGMTPRETYDIEMRRRINEKFPEHQSELDKVEAMYERDRKKAFLENENLDRQEDPLLSDSIKKQRAVDELMDGEMSKKLEKYAQKEQGHGKTVPEFAADWWGGGQKNRRGIKASDFFTGKGQFKGSPQSQTYLDKKPKEDSEKGRVGTLDDMAIDERVKNLKKQNWWDRTFGRSDEDDQLLLEDRIKSERSLRKQLKNQPPPYGRADYEGSLYRPFESALKKRIRKRREKEARTAKARGGILAQIS